MPTAGKGTYRELLRQGEHLLRRRVHPAPCDDAATDAFLLLEKVSGLNRTNYPLKKDARYPQAEREEYLALLRRRAAGEPVQYILGEWDFMGRDFTVGPGVLIPRPETEQLTEAAIDYLRKRPECRVLELCGGSGCIAITVAKTLPAANVTVLELSPEAMAYLRANMARHKADNVTAVQGDALCPPPTIQGPYDAILSNPPYIASGELPTLQKEVRQEPAMALDGGADGLDFYRSVCRRWRDVLHTGSRLAFEVGIGQADDVLRLMRGEGFGELEILPDPAGIPRVVTGLRYREVYADA